ncbi:hypothetical protein FRC03_002042 [Tulasnella sp. 419]|nr:hypothetical protein FRC03_002042 [Tulasnella sp. 419]
MMAMAILRGIYRVLANQLHRFVSASIKSLVARKAALPWNVTSPFDTPPRPKTPPTPRIRRVRFSDEVKQEMFDPSSPPRSRAKCLIEGLAEARAQPKIASAPRTTPRVTYQPAIRRVAFSSWVGVQEYYPAAVPKRIYSR